MLVGEFLTFLLEDTLETARMKHAKPCEIIEFQAVQRAVDDCRKAMQGNQIIEGLRKLLKEAQADSSASAANYDHIFWFTREVYVEWIIGVASAALIAQGRQPIITPTQAAIQEAIRVALPSDASC